jgi:hypothetical protein
MYRNTDCLDGESGFLDYAVFHDSSGKTGGIRKPEEYKNKIMR